MPSFKAFLLGNPVSSRDESEHRLSIPLALSVFAADALSSVAFASEEILIAITASAYAASAGWLSLPVTGVIVLLIAIVTLSYLQVVSAYPENGGTYAVAKDRLGKEASLLAAAALLIDYILVVSVGVSAGVAAITSTGLIPADWAIPVALSFIALMGFIILRGVRESGTALTIPAYGFIAFVLLMVTVGSFQLLNPGTFTTTQSVSTLPLGGWTWPLMLVLLKAFSHGCSALTGIEAVSNGVQVFKPPVTQNAQKL